ncbi:MAG: hypothetical protein GTN89_16980 [Acidobacteria bacterium]|nr:hypothetical protein [Acidobacteriota bacterium]NIM64079.1 hypothetical protein [Acidobacteriota bacterium]NIO60975.1 hypothetical protein [Acidobacteriota bacterium]NIQ31991.1 hypothetical protein [Acidobacteriota bacterium]NIQ87487.1 hypothetical protein [Acidobacteriota bacterium]
MSWLRDEDGYDLFFNRDEKRSRLRAEPPEVRSIGTTSVLAPRDGEAGGSWIAANEHGVSLALLNGYLGADVAAAPAAGEWTSRGKLVMDLADCATAGEAAERLQGHDLTSFRSFHLAAFDPGSSLLLSWSDGSLECSTDDSFSAPLISSSFNYEEVAESRRSLYREFSEAAGMHPVEAALAYHRSHRPARGPYSACMHREDARTISFTWVRVDADRVRMRYAPDSPCRGWPPGPALELNRA